MQVRFTISLALLVGLLLSPQHGLGNAGTLVYVAALEAATEDGKTTWVPTLYAIDVEQSKIDRKTPLPSSGSPVECRGIFHGRIEVEQHDGIVSLSTRPGNRVTLVTAFNAETLSVLEQIRRDGIADPTVPREREPTLLKPEWLSMTRTERLLSVSGLWPQSGFGGAVEESGIEVWEDFWGLCV
ncbi:MAG TPA: hypothetical protein PKH07_09910 [bacterium]|nr:hypothetical protein [bacterium]